jgi:hypothetical protein
MRYLSLLTLGLGLFATTPALAARAHHKRPAATAPSTTSTAKAGAVAEAPADTKPAEGTKAETPKKRHHVKPPKHTAEKPGEKPAEKPAGENPAK